MPSAEDSLNTRAMPYGLPVSTEVAKKVAAAAFAEAARRNHPVAVAVTDPAGVLIYFERDDNTANASSRIAIEKSRTAATFRRESAYFDQALMSATPRLAALAMPGLTPVSGGVPLVADMKVIGGVGVSGADTPTDIACAKAAAAAVEG
jgi:glc operon protein GlcG